MKQFKTYKVLYRTVGQGESIIFGVSLLTEDYAVFYEKNGQEYLMNYHVHYYEALNDFIKKTAYKFGISISTVIEYLEMFEEKGGEKNVI